jgi:predicted DsbA family dithiol-disulfide isomerase
VTDTGHPIRVDVWSDVQCIWCYISSARLRNAVARHNGDVEVVYRSFELTPDAPVEIDRDTHIAKQKIDPARMQRIMGQLKEMTAAEGLAYEPDLTQPTNSRLALELLHHADTVGARAELTQRLFVAYFAQGAHIGRLDDLVELAVDIGLDPDSARSALAQRRHRGDVDADVQQARKLGARGVPFYVVNDTWTLSGAQPTEQFLAVLQEAHP